MAFDKKNLLLGERYRLKRKIGEGGMATVYLALDEKLGRKVAVKVLHPHMLQNKDLRRRFYHEAQAISSLEHSNILKIYDFSGQSSKKMWIVTEIIKGHNLSEFVENFTNGKLNHYVSSNIIREVCKALHLAHQKNIVHRDIKPENVMITSKGEIKLMDFGIAKGVDNSSATQTGTFMGSPSYMSPEQVRGRDVDTRSDIYSLGIMFYEIATGRLPFTGNTTHDLIIKIAAGKFIAPNLINTRIPPEINKLIMELMSKDKLDRPETIDSISKQLDHILTAQGFVESHVELERYFKDRVSYESKLKQMEKNIASNKEKNFLLNKSNMISTITKKPQIKKPQYKEPEKKQQKIVQQTVRIQKPKKLPQKPQVIPVPMIAQKRPARKTRPPRQSRSPIFIPRAKTTERPHPRQPKRHVAHRYIIKKRSTSFSQTIVNLLIICVIALGTVFGYKELKKKYGDFKFHKTKQITQKAPSKYKSKRPRTQVSQKSAPKKVLKAKKIIIRKNTASVQKQKNFKKTKPRQNRRITIKTSPSLKTKTNSKLQRPTKKPAIITPVKNQKVEALAPKETFLKRTPEQVKTKPKKQEIKKQATKKPDSIKVERDLFVKSKPAANIYIDGKHYGTTIDSIHTSKKISLSALPVTVELRRDRYKSIFKIITRKDFKNKKKLTIGPMTLLQSKSTQSKNYTLRISSNQKNIEVKILDLKNKSLLSDIQKRKRADYDLEYGSYEVVVIWNNQTIKRRISLTGKSKLVSFHGEFQ